MAPGGYCLQVQCRHCIYRMSLFRGLFVGISSSFVAADSDVRPRLALVGGADPHDSPSTVWLRAVLDLRSVGQL